MVKQRIVPLTKDEMDRLMIEIEKDDEFNYLFFYILKTTGRREGELFGLEEKKEIGKRKIGERTIYIDEKPLVIDKVMPIYTKTGKWLYGVKRKDIDLEEGLMKVWVLKRREYVQDETLLDPKAIQLLSSYLNKNRFRLEDHIFRKYSLRALQAKIHKYAEKAKINHYVVIHNFRHYFITEMKRNNWRDEDIQVLTGHKSLASLSVYKHIIPKDLKDRYLETIKEI